MLGFYAGAKDAGNSGPDACVGSSLRSHLSVPSAKSTHYVVGAGLNSCFTSLALECQLRAKPDLLFL